MSETDILLVAGSAGIAILVTVVDLILSMIRHGRAARRRPYSAAFNASPEDEAAAAARREWIKRRLSAIDGKGSTNP